MLAGHLRSFYHFIFYTYINYNRKNKNTENSVITRRYNTRCLFNPSLFITKTYISILI